MTFKREENNESVTEQNLALLLVKNNLYNMYDN